MARLDHRIPNKPSFQYGRSAWDLSEDEVICRDKLEGLYGPDPSEPRHSEEDAYRCSHSMPSKTEEEYACS